MDNARTEGTNTSGWQNYHQEFACRVLQYTAYKQLFIKIDFQVCLALPSEHHMSARIVTLVACGLVILIGLRSREVHAGV